MSMFEDASFTDQQEPNFEAKIDQLAEVLAEAGVTPADLQVELDKIAALKEQGATNEEILKALGLFVAEEENKRKKEPVTAMRYSDECVIDLDNTPKGIKDIDVSAFVGPAQKKSTTVQEAFEAVEGFLAGCGCDKDKQAPSEWTEERIASEIMSCRRISYCPLCGKTFKLPKNGRGPACSGGFGEVDQHPCIQPLIMVPTSSELETGKPIDPLKLLQQRGLNIHD